MANTFGQGFCTWVQRPAPFPPPSPLIPSPKVFECRNPAWGSGAALQGTVVVDFLGGRLQLGLAASEGQFVANLRRNVGLVLCFSLHRPRGRSSAGQGCGLRMASALCLSPPHPRRRGTISGRGSASRCLIPSHHWSGLCHSGILTRGQHSGASQCSFAPFCGSCSPPPPPGSKARPVPPAGGPQGGTVLARAFLTSRLRVMW